MKILQKTLTTLMICALAAFCWTVAYGDTWDELVNGGGDAGDFPAGDFQAAPDDSIVYDVITGSNNDGFSSEHDAYLITITDSANFFADDVSGLISDTQAYLFDMGGNGLMANDDNPVHIGDGDFSFGFGNTATHANLGGTIVGTPLDVSDGDMVVLTVGGFNDVANGDAGNVFLDDAGDFVSLRGPTGSNFTSWTAAGMGGEYEIALTGARLASMPGKGCTNPLGDVNLDGSVNLLDVAPFVDLLTAGGFQCEADINDDGAVDLLDVAPFVDLLSP